MRFTSALRGSIVGWRERFDSSGWDVARWFPGHMAKGLKDMKSRLRVVDCLLEVHDARIPLSGRTPLLQEALGIRPHLLLLNKMDLADLRHKPRILEHLEQQGLKHILFTDCLKDENIKKIVPLVTELIGNSGRYHRAENLETCIMVIGAPNVGKSSVINSIRRLHLRKGKASRVGGVPGITRSVLTKIQVRVRKKATQLLLRVTDPVFPLGLGSSWLPGGSSTVLNSFPLQGGGRMLFNVCEQPLVYLLDTPGVLSPRIESVETGLKLALCGAILDHLVGEEVIADYLLYTLNHQQQFSYVERYGLASPCDNVETVLKSIALHLGKTQRVKVLTGTGNVTVTAPNYNAAACEFIYSFRKGLLGKVMLDEVQSSSS